jgi:hypothetical protein
MRTPEAAGQAVWEGITLVAGFGFIGYAATQARETPYWWGILAVWVIYVALRTNSIKKRAQ